MTNKLLRPSKEAGTRPKGCLQKVKKVSIYKTGVGLWWTRELSKYPVIWGKPGLSFSPQKSSSRCGHERMKGLAGILFGFGKVYFETALFWKAQLFHDESALLKSGESMNGSLSSCRIFLPSCLKKWLQFLYLDLRLASTALIWPSGHNDPFRGHKCFWF